MLRQGKGRAGTAHLLQRAAMCSCGAKAGALLLGLLCGCAGTRPAAPPQAFARASEPLPSPLPVAAVAGRAHGHAEPMVGTFAGLQPGRPTDAADTLEPVESARDRERRLRQELAVAADPTMAAIELAALLAAAERHDEAMAVVAAAHGKKPGRDLRILRAGLLRDVGQRHAAVGELRAVRREAGARRLHPELLFDLAELEALEGEASAATSTLQELLAVHATDPWVLAHGEMVRALQAQAAAGKPAIVRVRDVLGNLRGAPFADDRLEALELLLHSGEGDEHDALCQMAIEVALGDPAAAVRARAVQCAEPVPALRAEFAALALDDPEPLVRQRAVARVAAWREAGTVPLLLAQLDREADAATFLQICDALRSFADGLPLPSYAAASSAGGRTAIATDYRRRIRT
jgi:hypothetical protein